MYVKVKVGRRWAIARPTVGQADSYRTVALCDTELECDVLTQLANKAYAEDHAMHAYANTTLKVVGQ